MHARLSVLLKPLTPRLWPFQSTQVTKVANAISHEHPSARQPLIAVLPISGAHAGPVFS